MSILCSMVGASFTVAAAAEVIRLKKSVIAVGNAQIDTAQSQFGGASALFDGTGDYLFSPSNSDFGFGTGDFTLEGWFRFVNFTNGPALFDLRAAGGTEVKPLIYCGSDGVLYYYVNGAARITGSALSATTWYHITVSRASGSTKMFVNGTQVGSTYSDSNNYGTTVVSIGIASWNTAFNALNGHADEIRISNTARYTANFTPSTTAFVNDDNTLLLIHANGTDGSTFFEDDNGVRASIGITGVNQTKISTAQSKFSGASIEFDGTDDHLTLSTFPTTTGDLTYELWGRFDILPWNQTLGGGNFMQIAYAGGGDYLIINRSGSSGSQVLLQVATGNRYGSFTKSGVNLAINTWYHIAFVRTSGVWKAFFNGTELTTFINDSNFTNSGRTENVAYTQIGKFGDSRGSWDGYMDEIRFSNSARYTADFTPPTAPFVNDTNTLLLMHCDGTDATTVFRDDNGYSARVAKHISYYGNAQLDTAQSKFGGSSALFDGSGDYLQAPAGDWSFAGDFTVECWLRGSSFGSYNSWATSYQSSSGWYMALWNNDTMKIYIAGSNVLTGSSTFSANTWYHVAVVRSGTTMTYYKDGVSIASATVSGTISSSLPLAIGTNYEATTQGWIGHMDEFRVSNTARYTANFTPSTTPFQNDSNTLLLLHMDGADAATTFVDDVGGRSAKGITALGNAQVDTAQSKFGGSSALFDGTGDWLKGGFHPEYNFQGDFTIEFWARLNSNGGAYTSTITHAWGITGGLSGWYASTNAYNGTQKFGFSFVTNSGTKTELNYGSTLPLNTWMHLAVCRDGNKLYFYKDGVLLNSGGYTLTEGLRGFVNNYDFGIGASPYDQTGAYNGHLDEIRISNSARYPGGTTFTPSTTPFQNDANTLLLLHMDGSDGSTVFTDDNGRTTTP